MNISKKHILTILIVIFNLQIYSLTDNELLAIIKNDTASTTALQASISYRHLQTYLKTTNSLLYKKNLSTTNPLVFRELLNTQNDITQNSLTFNSITNHLRSSDQQYLRNLYQNMFIHPKVVFFQPSTNFYLNADYFFSNMSFSSYSTQASAAIHFSMLLNYILQPVIFTSNTDDRTKQRETILRNWAMLSQKSISYKLLHRSIKDRTVINDLGTPHSLGSTYPLERHISYKELDSYQANMRSHNSKWFDKSKTAAPITIGREKLFIYAELARTLYQQYRDGEEILIGLAGNLSVKSGFIKEAKALAAPPVENDIDTDPDSEEINPVTPEQEPSVPLAGSSTNKGSPFCFLSNRLFGRYSHESDALRNYRDNLLLESKVGRMITQTYYLTSPDFLEIIDSDAGIENIVNITLTKFIKADT